MYVYTRENELSAEIKLALSFFHYRQPKFL
jgi:hypothetical protein